jgi:hypothetical protein
VAGHAGIACRRSFVAVPSLVSGSATLCAARICVGIDGSRREREVDMVCGRFCRRFDHPRERVDAALVAAAGSCIGSLYWAGIGMFLYGSVLGRSGSDLLSRVLRRSTIGARGFHGRVRDGIGCLPPAITTRSSKHAPLRLSHSKRSGTHLSSAACSGLSLFS